MSRGHRLEIMAPAGCFEALTAAVQAGADSVYFGVEDLNMRSHSANNFTLADLPEIVRYCSEHDVKTYLALNIILYDEDVPKAYSTLDKSANRGSCLQLCRRGYRVTDLETGYELEIDNKYIMSPKDLCTIEFLDKMAAAGVSVFKIEGRARPAEYVQKVVSAYRAAADAVEAGTFTPEFGASFRDQLSQVFNRGFWDGYYQGARLGEWSSVYGSSATMKKVYAGKVNNYFSNLGVAEILVEAAPLKVGQHILIIGPTTGVVEMDIPEIRVPSDTAPQGVACSIPVPSRVRRADKLYIFERK